jgi:hypothetical protein
VDAQCKRERASRATDAAQRDYTRWLNDWLPIWQPALQKSTPDKTASKDWFGHHASPSRALWTLTAIMYRPESVLVDVGIDETTKRHFDLGAALIKWVKKAVPVGFGGLYPEPEVEFASQCAQVWYLRWPELDKKMLRYTRVAGKPFDHGWGLPPAGTLLRQTYPFLTFSRDEDGQLKLAGISREFLHALWLLEGGQ